MATPTGRKFGKLYLLFDTFYILSPLLRPAQVRRGMAWALAIFPVMVIKVLVISDALDVPLLFKQRFHHGIRSGALAFAFALSDEETLEYLQQAHTNLLRH